ncbi:MAG: beta-N-acetylhexosaminidase [Desulfobulbaceae bacterium]|nr:beta-N-acetylhexosaminidase [Desulfobulbaceae bacterium]
MSSDLRRLAGSLLMIGLPGTKLDDSTRQLISRDGVRNFIIFSRNVESPDQLRKLCTALADHCSAEGLPKPLISIDQEGGTVSRLPKPWTQFPDARLLAESPEPEQALLESARICSRELLDLGINMNMAPVLDVCPAGKEYFMERRSLGENPNQVARLGVIIIAEMQTIGVAACAKHFPGLGAARLDPHLTLPTVNREKSRLLTEDLVPFRAAIEAGVAAVMTSHTIYSDIDPDHPATLSASILTTILRNDLDYKGLIITDDLEMGAIENEMTVAEAALRSFQAGADLLLICHDHDKVRATIDTFTEALESGQIDRSTAEKALARQRLFP